MRKELIETLIRDVYGPSDPNEEINKNPLIKYSVGAIVPYDYAKNDNEDSPQLIEEEDYGNHEDESSNDTFLPPLISSGDIGTKPASFGISFTVNNEKPSFKICVTWGMYEKKEEDKWKRTPFHYITKIVLDEEKKIVTIYDDKEGGKIELQLWKLKQDSGYTIIVYVVNKLKLNCEHCKYDDIANKTIFQPSIRIKLLEGTELISLETNNYSEEDFLYYSYRERKAMARGHRCSAIWKDVDYVNYIDKDVIWADGVYFKDCEEFFNCDIRSEFIPLYAIPAPLLNWNENYGKPPELSTYKLSEMWDEIDDYLSPLVVGYEKWIKENEKLCNNNNDNDNNVCKKIIDIQKEFLERVKSGIEILKKDVDARLAFCFANRVMYLQHWWKKKEEMKLYPYQLAFILMSIEPIYNESSKYRDYVDLLWIPTGGGKTEAYSAIMAFTMALRRRKALKQGKTGGGTTIISRYTLRLLTIQQFRRILRMVTAAEYLRVFKDANGIGWRPKKSNIKGDLIYGSTRFSVGLWVGGDITPNHLIDDGIKVLMGNLDNDKSKRESVGEPAQVITCPVCDTRLAFIDINAPKGEKLFLVVKTDLSNDELKNEFQSYHEVSLSKIVDSPNGYKTIILELNQEMNESDIDQLWKDIESNLGEKIKLIPLRASRPGYFGIVDETRRKKTPIDFEIYCPNPDCDLNKNVDYVEGIPIESSEALPDKLYKRNTLFKERIPIPAFTVDEQIYSRCPTVIISTVDKFARLAYEPRARAIFGNVNKYNLYYGYYYSDGETSVIPEKTIEVTKSKSTDVNPFDPPELIIQDELHLIEGPLGSMVGLYEAVIEGLILEASGHKPKYIAATATARFAELQVAKLFARKLFIFPPNGLNITDNFFIRYDKDVWNDKKPGRIYMGILAPATEQFGVLGKVYENLRNVLKSKINDNDIKYYWTIVSYFNVIKELALGSTVYKDVISNETLSYELSSRNKATEIPQILDDLEKGANRPVNQNHEILFTTSMFGTGVDIPYLSLMTVFGQPKTTSQYIQATGRIGRAHSGLVIVIYKFRRPRDISYYEMFPAYHHRIYLEVEPSSVSPFSAGTLSRGAGPAMIAFLRNMRNPSVKWYDNDGRVILDSNSKKDIETFRNILQSRLKNIDLGKDPEVVVKYFDDMIKKWEDIAQNNNLKFVEYIVKPNDPINNVVLGDPDHERRSSVIVVYKNAPQSLRDVEETTAFEIVGD
ncbi:DNA/RNA helicase [Acidianus sulfidivorans JP7]|uniref:DNA/RNA helicase n=1 Tax=Acidianus sulfidivorans JP7 TaxID=619593 RepID=A0A2U9IQ07_9CREN|nr:DISARM system helicase DrmA [Acidianus sulfidivorans]AWR98138.1 DNA/RNA helicase [Acidianus sulfidivorans JP7]